MKKILFSAIFIAMAFCVNAQKMEEYTASNGITYHIGDTITLGRGSNANGDFNYLQMGGAYSAMMAMNGNYEEAYAGAGKQWSGLNVVIKKMGHYQSGGGSNPVFVVKAGAARFNLLIEQAIETCEIKDCIEKDTAETEMKETPSKYDQLREIKGLFDEGILTEEEYNAEKAKILNRQ